MVLADMFSPIDRQLITARGMTVDAVLQQIQWLQQGFPFVRLQRPCTVGDGIVTLAPEEIDYFIAMHDQAAHAGRVMKFVPASGAASRMFQSLLTLLNRGESLTPAAVAAAAESGDRECQQFRQFLARLEQFAFANALRQVMARDGVSLGEAVANGYYHLVLTYLLTPQGLNYANLPKGLVPFHRYADHTRTPFEEHLVEAAAYARDGTHTAHVHFTVPVEHREMIASYLQHVLPRYERVGCRYHLSLSVQKPSTDTIAVDHDNRPFRDQQGELVFRPGGHGALLENLNDLQGDIIFIKNIDNVVPDHLKAETYRYKKALGGYLVSVQNELFMHLRRLTQEPRSEAAVFAALAFARQKLFLQPPEEVMRAGRAAQQQFLMQKLNRPLRVCGMVRNTGEPGGGPFWVHDQDGALSLQIIESSQVNIQAADQRAVWQAATHFNPVDLVCGVRDFQGRPFDLHRFTDPATGFISTKSKDGKELRALELPGLWNGAMADWNTIFVETPLSTFNPVKTVYDLLRPEHLNA
ncbi:MAG TPA: DUF4301 family protein [Methylomirabilota bacterium]|nr:DUF4301 family protein [Methylomirabilota bacterium]